MVLPAPPYLRERMQTQGTGEGTSILAGKVAREGCRYRGGRKNKYVYRNCMKWHHKKVFWDKKLDLGGIK